MGHFCTLPMVRETIEVKNNALEDAAHVSPASELPVPTTGAPAGGATAKLEILTDTFERPKSSSSDSLDEAPRHNQPIVGGGPKVFVENVGGGYGYGGGRRRKKGGG